MAPYVLVYRSTTTYRKQSVGPEHQRQLSTSLWQTLSKLYRFPLTCSHKELPVSTGYYWYDEKHTDMRELVGFQTIKTKQPTKKTLLLSI